MSPLETKGQTQTRPEDYFFISADETLASGSKLVQKPAFLLAFCYNYLNLFMLKILRFKGNPLSCWDFYLEGIPFMLETFSLQR